MVYYLKKGSDTFHMKIQFFVLEVSKPSHQKYPQIQMGDQEPPQGPMILATYICPTLDWDQQVS